MRLVIEGDEKRIKQLAKELNVRAKRNNLKLSIESKKAIEVEKPKVVKQEKSEPKKVAEKKVTKK